MGFTGLLPEHVLTKMVDRPKGKRFRTAAEFQNAHELKLELELHRQFWAFLNRHNFRDVQYSNPHRRTTVKAGTADFLITRGNRRLGIEFKLPGKHLAPVQLEWFELANEQGNTVLCLDSYEAATKATIKFFNL